MKRTHYCLLLIGFALLAVSDLAAQRRDPGIQMRGNKLYGDLRMDERIVKETKALTFSLTLIHESGSTVGRQNVTANGRYQFLEVPNGIYEMVIERDGKELKRERFMLQETRFTDVRKDIMLDLQSDAGPGAMSAPGATLYARSTINNTRYNQALEAGAKKDLNQAAELLKQVVAADAKDYEAWTELGTVQFKQGNMGDADKSYQKSLEQRPQYFLALLNLGKLNIAQKNPELAIEVLTKALQVDPKSADANLFLGESYLQIKKGSKAVEYLNEAIRLDPIGKAEAHLRLATLYNAAQMKNRAAAEYEQFLAKKPDYPEKTKLEQYVRENKKP